MERKEILNKIQSIISEVADDENVVLTEDSTPSDVDCWDSLTHFQLVIQLQQFYGIKVSMTELQSWTSVGNIINSIESKLN
jgi:acyl carrier protein